METSFIADIVTLFERNAVITFLAVVILAVFMLWRKVNALEKYIRTQLFDLLKKTTDTITENTMLLKKAHRSHELDNAAIRNERDRLLRHCGNKGRTHEVMSSTKSLVDDHLSDDDL